MTLKHAIRERRSVEDSRKQIAISAMAPIKRALHEGYTQFTDCGARKIREKNHDGWAYRLSLDGGGYGPVTISVHSKCPQDYIVARKQGQQVRTGTDIASTLRYVAELMMEELKGGE